VSPAASNLVAERHLSSTVAEVARLRAHGPEEREELLGVGRR
jgi:hypothetical protein